MASWLSINPSPSSSTRLSQISRMLEVDPSVLPPEVLSPSPPPSNSVEVYDFALKATTDRTITKERYVSYKKSISVFSVRMKFSKVSLS